MHVGHDGQAERLADFGEDGQCRLESDPARGPGTRAVRLVERGLVDDADAQLVRDLLQGCRHFKRVHAAFELARPSEQRERQAVGNADVADLDHRIWRWACGMQTGHGLAFER